MQTPPRRTQPPLGCVALVAMLVVAPGVRAQTIAFRAAVSDAPAAPFTVSVGLWDAASGGTLLYQEMHDGVDASAGAIALELGGGVPTAAGVFDSLGPEVFSAPERYLELAVDGETLDPRLRFSAVGYAIQASHVVSSATLGGDPATALQKLIQGACPPGQSIRSIGEDGDVVCEFDDDSAYQAGSGLELTGASFAVDFAQVQARLSAACPAGSALRAIGADGAPTCALDLDTDTTYAAGEGLDLLGQTFAADFGVLQQRVGTSCGPGLAARAIDAKGLLTCEPIATGDVTAVTTPAGGGLLGGCASGDCQLAVDFGRVQPPLAACPANQVLRSGGGAPVCAPVATGDIQGAETATGSGLSSTCTSGPCTVRVRNTETQRRVTGSCTSTQGIRTVLQAGGVACQNVFTGDIEAVETPATGGLQGGCTSGTCALAADPPDFFPAPQTVYTSGSILVDTSLAVAETVRSATIAAPADFGGTVFAYASGDAVCETQLCTPLEMRLATSPANVENTATDTRVAGPRLRTVGLTGAFDVQPGESVTVYWRAGIVNGEVRVRRPRLTVFFVPKRL